MPAKHLLLSKLVRTLVLSKAETEVDRGQYKACLDATFARRFGTGGHDSDR
jgi:hypothetical protein